VSLTTSESVKQNTEIEVEVVIYKAASNQQNLFINPEVTITAA